MIDNSKRTGGAIKPHGQSLSQRLGQSVVIENRPGAGTNIAMTVLGIVNRWMTIHRVTARPNASLMRSPPASKAEPLPYSNAGVPRVMLERELKRLKQGGGSGPPYA